MKKLFAILLLILLSNISYAQQNAKEKGLESIKERAVLSQLKFLSSDYFEGRDVIGKGGVFAANYIASEFEALGLLPAGDLNIDGSRSYFQKIPMTMTFQGDKQRLEIISNNSYKEKFVLNTDYFLSMPEVTKEISAEIIFVGYGMIDKENLYNDFEGLDLTNKVAVRLKGFPGRNNSQSETFKKFAPKNPKARIDSRVTEGNLHMIKSGILAVIEINSLEDISKLSNKYAENVSYYPSERIPSSSGYRVGVTRNNFRNPLITISVSPRLGSSILSGSGIAIDNFEKNVEKSQKPQSKLIANKKINFEAEILSRPAIAYNVLAKMEGEDNTQNVVLGAHYDHLGINENYIWNGADDNASGTVAVMSIGAAFKASGVKPRCNIIFAAWTAEEIGLVGSSYFVNNFKTDEIKANVNFDMIAREITDGSNEVSMRYLDTKPLLVDYTKENIKTFNINLTLTATPLKAGVGGSTDFAAFSAKNIPFITWKAGHREDYHRHTDDFSKINKDIFYNIIKLSFLTTWDIVNKPLDYIK